MTSTLILTCSCGASMTYAGINPQSSRDAFLAAHASCRKTSDRVDPLEIERSLRTLKMQRGGRPLGLT